MFIFIFNLILNDDFSFFLYRFHFSLFSLHYILHGSVSIVMHDSLHLFANRIHFCLIIPLIIVVSQEDSNQYE